MSIADVSSRPSFSIVRRSEDAWTGAVDRPGQEIRDLGIADATAGRVSILSFRPAQAASPVWHRHAADVRFVYALAGTSRWAFGVGRESEIAEGACACIPPGMPVRMLGASADAEFLDVMLGEPTLEVLDAPEAGSDPGSCRFAVTALTEGSWKTGAGRRPFLAYRDLGVAEATDGRMRAHVTRATGAPGETGWHYHQCGMQVVYRLGGRGFLLFEQGKPISFDAGTCICIPPETPHDERRDAQQSVVLEVLLGDRIDTVQCPAPSAEGRE